MKKNIQYLTLAATILLTFLVGCSEFTDKIDDFNIGITNTIFEQSAVIELKDYFGNHEDIISTDFTVTFGGTDADKLVNEAGEFTISETDGFIQLNVNPNKSTGVKELNFDVIISGGDYRTESFPVKLTDTTSHVRLSLVNKSKIYKGTNTATQTVGLTNNASTTVVTIKTDKTTSLNKSAVTIKTGTQFKDISGNELVGTTLNVEVTNTDDAGQTLKFTDNLTFKDINGAAITDKTVHFIAGKTNIKMKVGGTSVKTFNTPVNVAIEIPSDATNPITNNPVQLGDDFPVYTSEDDSTIWTYHGVGKVAVGDTNSTFNIAFETTHLSDYAVLNFKDRGCPLEGTTYNLTATNLPADFSGFLEVEYAISSQGFPVVSSSSYNPIINLNFFSVWITNGKITWWTVGLNEQYPEYTNYQAVYGRISEIITSRKNIFVEQMLGGPLKHHIIVKLNGVQVRDNIFDIATTANCELAINFNRDLIPNIDNLKSVNIDVASSCNGNAFVPDGFPFYVLRENGQFSYEGTIRKGKMTLNGFELGKEYIFKTVYKGVPLLRKWTFDSENFVDHNFKIPQAACDALGL